MLEIERKYLVTSEGFRKRAKTKMHILQGFLNTDPERTVRIRICDDRAYLTIKGKSNSSGLSRFEWEKQLTISEGRALLELCEKPIIEKYRYLVPEGAHVFEVDEFLGDNRGLLLAEVELRSEDEKIHKPEWLGQEVTGRAEYYNSQLINKPFSTWKHLKE